jgi:hypothetical protein
LSREADSVLGGFRVPPGGCSGAVRGATVAGVKA